MKKFGKGEGVIKNRHNTRSIPRKMVSIFFKVDTLAPLVHFSKQSARLFLRLPSATFVLDFVYGLKSFLNNKQKLMELNLEFKGS